VSNSSSSYLFPRFFSPLFLFPVPPPRAVLMPRPQFALLGWFPGFRQNPPSSRPRSYPLYFLWFCLHSNTSSFSRVRRGFDRIGCPLPLSSDMTPMIIPPFVPINPFALFIEATSKCLFFLPMFLFFPPPPSFLESFFVWNPPYSVGLSPGLPTWSGFTPLFFPWAFFLP